jgi:hypothetical protein
MIDAAKRINTRYDANIPKGVFSGEVVIGVISWELRLRNVIDADL